MRGDRARGWPVKTHITLASATAKQQEWTIEAAEARKPLAMKVEPGKYTLTIAAAQHRAVTREIAIEKDLSLPEIALPPIPAISGRVIERQKEVEVALAGAQILAGEKQLATTDTRGVFRVELTSEPTPASITVVHTGQAPKTIPLFDNLAAENELGTIELDRGVTLTVRLDRRYDEPKPLVVSIWNRKVVARREVKPAEDDVPFSGLAPGNYMIVVKGTEPLEVMNEKVEVHDSDLEQRVTIAPFPLDGRVSLGNDALRAGGKIEIAGSGWRTEAAVNEEGRFGGSMWQHGKVTGWLTTSIAPEPLMEVSPELGPGPSLWQIALKRRFIEGHIVDAATKEPIPDAAVEVEIVSGERRTSSSVAVGKDGGYAISAMQNGRYDIRVTAPDHADARRVAVVDDLSNSRTFDFQLEGGVEVVAYFVWNDERPVAGAAVIRSDGKLVRTDAAGRAVFSLHPGEARIVAVLPREGSLAAVELQAPRRGTADPVRVVVLPPAGSLRITIKDRRLPLIVRYNGNMLPAAAVALLAGDTSDDGPIRLRRLPAGAYDLGTGFALTARVTITYGEEAVELRGSNR